MSFPTYKIVWVLFASTVAVAGTVRAASANEQNAINGQSAYQPAIAVPSRLQVTGTAEKFTLDVERADVQSTLKTVLKQAGKEFSPDATVNGQVTLLLTQRSLDTVLHAICDQCYLRYAEVSGIYKFTRDDDAIKKAFNRLNDLNTALRQQLRALGLDVPDDNALATTRSRQESLGRADAPAAGLSILQDASKREAGSIVTPAQPLSVYRSDLAPGGPLNRASGPATSAKSIKPKDASKIANIHMNFMPMGEQNQLYSQNSRGQNVLAYDAFLRQNGFVWFNVPEEKPEAVATVLQQFSQQSNVPILMDQTIPNSLKFRVWGTLSPRQLPEALNILAPTAHLQWRWIGSMVFVFPSPDFRVYFDDQPSARYFQRGAVPRSPSETNPPADAKDKKGGSQ